MAKKTKKSAKATDPEITPIEPEKESASESDTPVHALTKGIEDPLGEPADGEGKIYLGDESTFEVTESEAASAESDEPVVAEELTPEPQGPVKLERLQKILSQAGIASRRAAEEMIEQGRVQVNGKVVTELGSKADPARDHIRVDGKLLHGAERHRYFILNKPKGYVTTVSDPEGRPTVMTFFEKMRERLYPVGRLDYLSEGLLLVTNDGELANQLTKAASGVEKTYLVKIAGQPSEDDLDRLRGGVAIDREQPGSGKVHTAPARIRLVRQGDNPWYEVVLIEGRNRELRKMFSAIGHFVEKIRRVGYGPLVLDVEPGKLRELEPEEVSKLRLAAEGKLRAPKPKEVVRRNRAEAGYAEARHADSPRPVRPKSSKPFERRGRDERNRGERTYSERPRGERTSEGRRGEFRPKRSYGAGKPLSEERPERGEYRPKKSFGAGKPFREGRPERGEFRPRDEGGYRSRPPREGAFQERPFRGKPGGSKPDWKKTGGDRPESRQPAGERRFERPGAAGPRGRSGDRFEKPRFDRPKFDKPRSDRPRFDRSERERPPRREFSGPPRQRGEWVGEERPRPPRRRDESERPDSADRGQRRTGGPRPGGRPFRPGGSRPSYGGGAREASGSRPSGSRPAGSRPGAGGAKSRGFGKPGERKSGFGNRSGGGARRGGPRPGGGRRFTS